MVSHVASCWHFGMTWLCLAGREGNTYGASAGLKKQKAGGTSNRQKSKSKNLPKAAFQAAQGHRRQHTARHNVKTNFKGRRARTRK